MHCLKSEILNNAKVHIRVFQEFEGSFCLNSHTPTYCYLFKSISCCVQQVQATFPSSNPEVVIATTGTMAQAEDWTLKLQTATWFV